MTQFYEGKSKVGKCPVCGKPVVIRTTRGKVSYCSRVCASQIKYGSRYTGTMAGPAERPKMVDKTKL
jgi:endogenous inhibitor of DNA gyrase (YacG/DUF329 family)